MSIISCRRPDSQPTPPLTVSLRGTCKPLPREFNPEVNHGLLATDMSAAAVVARIRQSGFQMQEVVRPYAVTTLKIQKQRYWQTGSAPNFQGGLVTLCTCKHQMRGNYSAESWEAGAWVAGLTSMSESATGEQNLFYLMRVYRAYESHADLVAGLPALGLSAALAAKDSMLHDLGDVMMPLEPGLRGEARFTPDSYHPPMPGHAHRQPEDPDYWHKDIRYTGRACRPSLLVGDPALSFIWTRPLVRRKNPQAIRDYENWTLGRLLGELQEVPA